MDIKEASAMTEASRLQQGGSKKRSNAEIEHRRSRDPSADVAMRWADQLRGIAVKAPLQSLLVAFLLGAWVTRRR